MRSLAMSFTLRHEAEASPRPAGRGLGRAGRVGIVAVVVALLAGGVLLWAKHGATVFFDLMSAGIAACL